MEISKLSNLPDMLGMACTAGDILILGAHKGQIFVWRQFYEMDGSIDEYRKFF